MNTKTVPESSPTAQADNQTTLGVACGQGAVAMHGDDELVRALDSIRTALKYLGTGDAGTAMGAIEYVAVRLGDALEHGFGEIASAIREAAEIVAAAQAEAARAQRRSGKGKTLGGDEESRLPDVGELLAKKQQEIHGLN